MVTRPFPLHFEMPGGVKQLRVERVDDTIEDYDETNPLLSVSLWATNATGHWRLWLMANGDYTLGTFIQLCDDGKINRVTWHDDGTETILEYKT